MIKIENVETAGWEPALRGMRNPMNSWDKTDSTFSTDEYGCAVGIGPNDHDLAMRLRNAGTDHRKFMRMIVCYCDITAPLYWWKEFDTYRNGVEKNSCSTMHKITSKEFTMEDFSFDHTMDWVGDEEEGELFANPMDDMQDIVDTLNTVRERYLFTKGKPVKEIGRREKNMKKLWYTMIQILPSSYNQRRTVMMSYEALANMYHARRNHKLDEWKEFCKWVETLPYSELITGEENHEAL